jgi:hypothetical protein
MHACVINPCSIMMHFCCPQLDASHAATCQCSRHAATQEMRPNTTQPTRPLQRYQPPPQTSPASMTQLVKCITRHVQHSAHKHTSTYNIPAANLLLCHRPLAYLKPILLPVSPLFMCFLRQIALYDTGQCLVYRTDKQYEFSTAVRMAVCIRQVEQPPSIDSKPCGRLPQISGTSKQMMLLQFQEQNTQLQSSKLAPQPCICDCLHTAG